MSIETKFKKGGDDSDGHHECTECTLLGVPRSDPALTPALLGAPRSC